MPHKRPTATRRVQDLLTAVRGSMTVAQDSNATQKRPITLKLVTLSSWGVTHRAKSARAAMKERDTVEGVR